MPTIASELRGHRLTSAALRLARERADLRLLRRTNLFDPEAYRRRYHDVASKGIDPTRHYLRRGSEEGREPGPLFDASDYLDRYPDVAIAGMNPVLHYLRHGRTEGRRVRPASLASSREPASPGGQEVAAPAVVRSRGPALRVSTPVLRRERGRLVVACDIDGAPTLRAVLDGPADVISRIEPRVEPFLPVALMMAGAAQCDLIIDAPVDPNYLATLRLNCVPLLRVLFDFPLTKIELNSSDRPLGVASVRRVVRGREDPAALLFSGGVDSFYSLTRLRSVGYPLRMLVNVHAGAHCHQACKERRQQRVRRVAHEAGYEALMIETNFHDVVDADHSFAHPFRTLPAGYTAYPSIGGLFLSPAASYHDLSFDVFKGGAEVAGSTIPGSIAWNRMPVTEIGYEHRRFEKMRIVADEPLSYGALDVCVSGDHPPEGDPGKPVNCGECFKCARAILSLDAMGRLDRYQSQFDLSGYPANREDLLRRVRRSDNYPDRDLLGRLAGQSPPPSGALRLARPSWATETNAEGLATTRVTGPSKVPIRLHWWRGQRGVPNAGDELSPLIVERVSGRKVIYSAPETCHLVAIGSLAEVALRADRDWPVRLWGSGFIGDGPTLDYRHHQVLVDALRGPYSATRLGVDDVPLGDPGLLANLLLEGPMRKVRPIGIVPGYNELDLPIIEVWRSASDAVISPHLPPAEFIDAIAECDLILSSSLHGLVIADGLGIPNAWVEVSDRVAGRGFKFRDHLRSLGRPEDSQRLPMPDDMSQLRIDDLVNGYAADNVAGIRERLVDAFPSI